MVWSLSTLIMLAACGNMNIGKNESTGDSNAGAREEAMSAEFGRLYRQYLSGDPEEARASLEKIIEEVTSADISDYGKADYLRLAYERLFVLDSRLGNQDAADIYLLKAKYWTVRMSEELNERPDRIAATIGVETAEYLSDIERVDKGATNGRGPAYLDFISEATTTEHIRDESPSKRDDGVN